MVGDLYNIILFSIISPILNKFVTDIIESLSSFASIHVWPKFRRYRNSYDLVGTTQITAKYTLQEDGDDVRALANFLIYKKAIISKIKTNTKTEFPDGIVYYKKYKITFYRTIDNAKDMLLTYYHALIQSNKSMDSIQRLVEKAKKHYESILSYSDERHTINMSPSGNIGYVSNFTTTFDDIFLSEKQEIRDLIDIFESGKCQFNKLSFLLYGEPGCGKTSLIKAMAKQTGRHIMNYKLKDKWSFKKFSETLYNSKIKTDKRKDKKIPMNKQIIVLEDFDCDNLIVLDGRDNEIKDFKGNNIPGGERPITLSDLLGIFDGLIELRGAIIILTTNYKEKIDPALIRPGRIDFSLELKKMRSDQAKMMIQKYCGDHEIYLPDYLITPAELESMCKRSYGNLRQFEELLKKWKDFMQKM